MKIGAPGLVVAAAAQQVQPQRGPGSQSGPVLPDTAAAVAQAAVDGRNPKLAQETAIQAQAAEKEQDGPGDDVARRIFGAGEDAADPTAATEEGADGLTPAEERVVRALQQRDAAVRRHEQAHAAAGGAYAGAPQYQYTTGPDGRRYAISGEVSISTGAVSGDPAATIAKLQAVKRAALAPTDPSPQDRRVAAQADLGIAQARVELREERAEEAREQREQTGEAKEGAASGAAAPGDKAGTDTAAAETDPTDTVRGRAADAPGAAAARDGAPPAIANDRVSGLAGTRLQGRAEPPGARVDLVV